MPRGRIYYNPTNFISWQDNFELFTVTGMTLIGLVRLLIDQATGTGTLNDYPVPGDIFWPAQQLYDATNEVMDDYWPQAARQPIPVQLATAALVVGTGTDIYLFDSTGDTIMIPTFVVLNTMIANASIDQKYFTSDQTKLEQWSRNWRGSTPAQPRAFILWDALHLRCFPTPDQTYTFTVFGVPWPVELGTGTEDITADPIFKMAIAYKAAANVLESTRPDVTDSYLKESEELMLRYRIRLRNQQTNNLRRLKPGSGDQQTDIVIGGYKGVIKIMRRLS